MGLSCSVGVQLPWDAAKKEVVDVVDRLGLTEAQAKKLYRVFCEVDVDGSNLIAINELLMFCGSPRLLVCFASAAAFCSHIHALRHRANQPVRQPRVHSHGFIGR
jgi:hypothetical protein